MATAEGRARFLAIARPLWTALPDGALKRQLLGELASVATLDASELTGLWLANPAKVRPPAVDAAQAPPRRLVRAARQATANQLDRVLWLLLHRAELWWEIDGEAHDLLAGQATPYAALFANVERCLHDHGPMSPAALLDELTQAVGDDEHARTTLHRIASFHDPEAQTDLKLQLHLLLDQLRLQEVDHELKLLFESGLMSPDIQARSALLMQSRARLKAALSQATPQPI